MIFHHKRRALLPSHEPVTVTMPERASHLETPTLRQALATPGMGKINALAQWWPTSRLARSIARYFLRDGDLMASGMALTILVSLTAALTVAFTIFMAVLGSYTELRASVIDSLNKALPGLLTAGGKEGLVDPADFVTTAAITPTSVIAFTIMAWSGLSVVGRLGRSIRTMFGVVATPESFLITTLRSFAGVIGLAVSVLLGSGVGFLVDFAGANLLELIGLADSSISYVILQGLSYLVPFLIHMWVSWLLIRVVSGIRVPQADLWAGILLMAAGSTSLRILGTGAVASVSGPILTTATTLITLVLWINVQMRLTLFISAWIANPPRSLPITNQVDTRFYERPNYVTMSDPSTLAWPHHNVSGEVEPAPEKPSLPEGYTVFLGNKRRTLKSWLFGSSELKTAHRTEKNPKEH